MLLKNCTCELNLQISNFANYFGVFFEINEFLGQTAIFHQLLNVWRKQQVTKSIF